MKAWGLWSRPGFSDFWAIGRRRTLRPRSPAFLRAARAGEVGEQAGEGLVGLAGELFVISLDVVVPIPGELIIHAARVNLDEPDAVLDQPAGRQALAADMFATGIIEAVELLDMCGLAVDCDRFGAADCMR